MKARRCASVASLFLVSLSCRAPEGAGERSSSESGKWAVTAWGERYEVFAETDALIAGAPAACAAHLTVLNDFSPLKTGSVVAVLRDDRGTEVAFRRDQPSREGIYGIELRPLSEGIFDISFRVEAEGATEEIPAGKVRVGSRSSPGGLVSETDGSPTEEVPFLPFLKEQQWRTEFGTAWVAEGSLQDSVVGPARVIAPSGGEVLLTARIDATVLPEPWPYPGLDVAQDATVFRMVPRLGGRSLPELEGEAAALDADLGVARQRLERLTELDGK